MKIGVVTHHWVPNFGANLQAYATVQALRGVGGGGCCADQLPPVGA